MELFGVPLWGFAGYSGVTHSPEADMIRYGKQTVLWFHKKFMDSPWTHIELS